MTDICEHLFNSINEGTMKPSMLKGIMERNRIKPNWTTGFHGASMSLVGFTVSRHRHELLPILAEFSIDEPELFWKPEGRNVWQTFIKEIKTDIDREILGNTAYTLIGLGGQVWLDKEKDKDVWDFAEECGVRSEFESIIQSQSLRKTSESRVSLMDAARDRAGI